MGALDLLNSKANQQIKIKEPEKKPAAEVKKETPAKKENTPKAPVEKPVKEIKPEKPAGEKKSKDTKDMPVNEPKKVEKSETNPKGAGRKPNTIEHKTSSVSLCPLTIKQISRLSDDMEIQKSRLIELAVDEYIKKHDPELRQELIDKFGYEIDASSKDGYKMI